MSVRKISASRLSDYSGPRRLKPRLNAQKAERLSLFAGEESCLAALFHDDDQRAAISAGLGEPREPMSVWVDSDQSYSETLLQPCELPAWEALTERMKLFVGYDAAMEFGWAYSFTANIAPELVETWRAEGSDFLDCIKLRLYRAMKKKSIVHLPRCFVVEARTKSGKTRNKPHIHGVVMCDNPVDATRFKVALEDAFADHLGSRKRRRAVKVERSYAKRGTAMGRFQWISYITKNTHLYDARFGKRRVYVSRSFNQIARHAWAVRRDDQLMPRAASI